MSKAGLKKTLKKMKSPELVEMICELYDARKEVKDYLEYWLDPQPEKLLETTKKKIFKVFFISEKSPRKSPSMTDLKSLISNFRSLCFDTEKIADINIYVFEQYVDWLERRSRIISHREKVEKFKATAEEYIDAYMLNEMFGIRLERVTERFETVMKRGDRKIYRYGRGWYR